MKKQKIHGQSLFQQIKTQLKNKASEKGNWIEVTASKDLIIWADYDRIVQILINLVTNSIQFSEDSSITLSGYMTETSSIISVEDHGIGIDADQIQSIWERFYKADVSRKNTKFGESGIGLAVVHSLVEAHDGKIKVESEIGKGSKFTIELPKQSE